MKNILAKFTSHIGGNVAITSALALPTVVMVAFAAVDYGSVVQAKQELKAAAGAAALAAANEGHIAYASDQDLDIKEIVRDTAEKMLLSRVEQINSVDVTRYTITPDVTNNVFSVDISYEAKVTPNIISLAGQDSLLVKNNQRAQVSATSYINFNFMFDVSGSMGVGATTTDMEQLYRRTGCAIACHTNAPRGRSRYDTARRHGINMRIDVARESARAALNIMEDKAEIEDRMTVGMHIYDNRPIEIADDQSPLASNFSTLRNKLNDVQLTMTHGGSNTEGSMKKVIETIPQSGSGRTPDDRIQYLIVLTDGIENSVFNNPGGSDGTPGRRGWDLYRDAVVNQPALNAGWHQKIYAPAASSCDTAKRKDIGVYFINTEYLVPETNIQGHGRNGDWRFQGIERQLHDLTTQRMVSCAGNADNVIKVSTPAQIEAAFKEIVGSLSSPLRLF